MTPPGSDSLGGGSVPSNECAIVTASARVKRSSCRASARAKGRDRAARAPRDPRRNAQPRPTPVRDPPSRARRLREPPCAHRASSRRTSARNAIFYRVAPSRKKLTAQESGDGTERFDRGRARHDADSRLGTEGHEALDGAKKVFAVGHSRVVSEK